MTDETLSEIPDVLYVPRGRADQAPYELNLRQWAEVEARIVEIGNVTPTKAPELLATFNRAALDLDRLANTLELEYQISLREAEKIKAVVLLDRVPAILREKGLATAKNPMGSEDLRSAVLAQDPDYDLACERSEMLKAMTKMLRGKYDAMERAFRSVRTLVGEQNFNFTTYTGAKTELSHGKDSQFTAPVGIRPAPAVPAKAGFGTPKFAGKPATAKPLPSYDEAEDVPY